MLRQAVRVLVVNDRDEVLLLEDSDPAFPDQRWWVTPGGGADPGESESETAIREVAEETGYRLRRSELIGPVARRHVVHGYSDQIMEQDETFYLARVRPFEVDISHHTEDEKVTLQRHHWWSRAELAGTDQWIWPAELQQLWEHGLQMSADLIELGDQEESTVLVGC